MLNKLKNRKQEGFTIIEVMIVLAIAGLIILIVLLAVPALQRNGRNTAIKNDAGAVLGAISDFSSNNEGASPDSVDGADGTVTVSASGKSSTTAKIQSNTKVTSSAFTAGAQTPQLGEITVYLKTKCPTTISGDKVTFTTSENVNRSQAVVYSIETSSGNLAKCISS